MPIGASGSQQINHETSVRGHVEQERLYRALLRRHRALYLVAAVARAWYRRAHRDLGWEYFQHRDPERATKPLVRQLEGLRHSVMLEALAS